MMMVLMVRGIMIVVVMMILMMLAVMLTVMAIVMMLKRTCATMECWWPCS